MVERSYFDWNATTPLRPEALAALADALAVTGNPSSVHAEGRAARKLVERAREQVAQLVGARPADVIFTGSGTEANMLALTPAIETAGEKRPRDKLLMSAIEHSSVRAGGRFPRDAIEDIPVDADGRVNLAALAEAVSKASRPLVSLMLANNETGVVQPVAEAAAIVHAAGGLLHVDAVQAAGRIAVNIGALGADLLTLSGHKIGGLKGVGALVRGREDIHFSDPLIRGGGQERGARAGTENVAGIVAFGAAAEVAHRQFAEEAAHMLGLRDLLEEGLRAISPQAIIFGEYGRATAEYDPVCVGRRKSRDRSDRLRPRRRGGFLGRRLLVREGATLPCPCRHGGFAPAHPRRGSRQPRLDDDKSRRRTLPWRLEKARKCTI